VTKPRSLFPVAILAGGLATRLRPITETVPKSLVEVAGKPFVAWQLEYLAKQGVSHVVLCLGYLGEMIQRVVDTGEQFGLKVSYSFDGTDLLGTGGALKRALSVLSRRFFVMYGDSYLPVDFRSVQEAYIFSRRRALMTVLENKNRWDKSNVLFENGRLIEYNKHTPRPEMNHIDYGLGLIDAGVFDRYHSSRPFDLAAVYHELSLNGELTGYEVYQRFYEIGSLAGLEETKALLITKEKM
jgi:MurNAc alpha-1-phosphate uridylyltransferase